MGLVTLAQFHKKEGGKCDYLPMHLVPLASEFTMVAWQHGKSTVAGRGGISTRR